jgi:hypothetical protein
MSTRWPGRLAGACGGGGIPTGPPRRRVGRGRRRSRRDRRRGGGLLGAALDGRVPPDWLTFSAGSADSLPDCRQLASTCNHPPRTTSAPRLSYPQDLYPLTGRTATTPVVRTRRLLRSSVPYSLESMAATYDLLAAHYDAVTGDSATEATFIDEIIKHACGRAVTLLEVACGTGGVIARLAARYDVSGLDSHPGPAALPTGRAFLGPDRMARDFYDREASALRCAARVCCLSQAIRRAIARTWPARAIPAAAISASATMITRS